MGMYTPTHIYTHIIVSWFIIQHYLLFLLLSCVIHLMGLTFQASVSSPPSRSAWNAFAPLTCLVSSALHFNLQVKLSVLTEAFCPSRQCPVTFVLAYCSSLFVSFMALKCEYLIPCLSFLVNGGLLNKIYCFIKFYISSAPSTVYNIQWVFSAFFFSELMNKSMLSWKNIKCLLVVLQVCALSILASKLNCKYIYLDSYSLTCIHIGCNFLNMYSLILNTI